MVYDEFFTDSDKPYAENLNDSLMLLDAFDVTVPCEMPTMFNNGDFSSSVNVTRKCGVALVTLKSVDSGVTVGTDSISGTGSVVFRVYPNFNSFYKWSKIILEKSGTVAIGFKKADGTDITVTVASDGTIGDAAALKMLEEIDVVLTLDNASISNILIWFVNNQGERVRTGALLEAEQLVNVDGAVVDNDLRAVSGETVKGAFDDFETDVVDEKIGDLSDSVDSMFEWVEAESYVGNLYVNEALRLANFLYQGNMTFNEDGEGSIEIIPNSYKPIKATGGTARSPYLPISNPITITISTGTTTKMYAHILGKSSLTVQIIVNMIWRY